jgi:hypothetical protein
LLLPTLPVALKIVGAALATSKSTITVTPQRRLYLPPCRLTFTTTSIAGKSMIVQATNTGGDLGSNQFDLAIPGGGVGIFNACTDEFNAPSSGWGAQYGGISSNTCSTFPKALQAGCGFRWDWFEGADNPEVEFERVECPAEIVAKSGCKRDDDGAQVKAAVAASKAPVASSSPVAAASSSSSAAVQSLAKASSSVEAVAVASSASFASEFSAVSSAVVASSAADYAATTFESSAAYTSAAASIEFSPSSAAAIEVSSTAASLTTTPSSPASSEDAACNVQYVYEYDL